MGSEGLRCPLKPVRLGTVGTNGTVHRGREMVTAQSGSGHLEALVCRPVDRRGGGRMCLEELDESPAEPSTRETSWGLGLQPGACLPPPPPTECEGCGRMAGDTLLPARTPVLVRGAVSSQCTCAHGGRGGPWLSGLGHRCCSFLPSGE